MDKYFDSAAKWVVCKRARLGAFGNPNAIYYVVCIYAIAADGQSAKSLVTCGNDNDSRTHELVRLIMYMRSLMIEGKIKKEDFEKFDVTIEEDTD